MALAKELWNILAGIGDAGGRLPVFMLAGGITTLCGIFRVIKIDAIIVGWDILKFLQGGLLGNG